jgi:hypothetical protein
MKIHDFRVKIPPICPSILQITIITLRREHPPSASIYLVGRYVPRPGPVASLGIGTTPDPNLALQGPSVTCLALQSGQLAVSTSP